MASFSIAYRSLSTSVKPILVFVLDRDKEKDEKGKEKEVVRWKVENVGKGPALNVVIYGGIKNEWGEALNYYHISAGVRSKFPIPGQQARLGASYEDAHGRKYHSICENYRSRLGEEDRPAEWTAIKPVTWPFQEDKEPADGAPSAESNS